MQVPALPGTAHERHASVQAVWQQIPWAQNPELQSSGPPQTPPMGRFPQLPLLQLFGAAHSAPEEQLLAHCWPPGPQTNGAQL
jgi:hypothetical protein